MPLDTSEINMDNHRNRIKAGTGLGATGNNEDLSFFIYASLLMDATTETSLGFSDIQLWHREADREQKNYKNLPIEQKESYKWIKASGESKKHPSGRAGGEVALKGPLDTL